MALTIRAAGHADCVPVAMFLIEQFHGSYTHHFPPVDERKVVVYVAQHIEHGVVLMAERDGELVGVISGRPAECWFSSARHVAEGFFFVHPEHRASRAAIRLLQGLKDYAADIGLPLVCGVTAGDDVERKDKFFERQGLRRVGGTYTTEG